MKYIQMYDAEYDEVFQAEINQELVDKIGNSPMISDKPWPNIPIKPSSRAARHPEGEWDKYLSHSDYVEAHKNGPCGPDCPLNSRNSGASNVNP